MRHRVIGGVIVLAAVAAAAVGIASCGGGGTHHKATCWKPSYAAAPTAIWARNPSVTHRHGAGPRGKDVCDGK